eukprot:CAMPEP_0176495628 /NCGR_PEP_ID=MMETSP0200_2-20121128/10762_1 /TAXON_ID=947934 /ORGANISM="Chaetoceros sp., Strain GSL56" /LENGTH=345 /DNA_ID=CAMNT_0017893527 /DNA_START=67 /DNA_END=1104 /DNA_ORIENTATION=+
MQNHHHQVPSHISKPSKPSNPKRRVQFQKIPQVRIWESDTTTGATTYSDTMPIGTIEVNNSEEIKDDIQRNARLLWYSADELDQMRNDVKKQSKIFRTSLHSYVSTNHQRLKTTTTATNTSSNCQEDATPSSLGPSLFFPFENSHVEKKMQILRYELPSNCTSSTTFRGLEPRIFIEKQVNRVTVIKSVFQFQHRVQTLLNFAQSNGRSEDVIKRMKDKYSERLGIMCAEISSWARHEALSSAGYDAKCANEILKCSNASDSGSDCGCSVVISCSSEEEEEEEGNETNVGHDVVGNNWNQERKGSLVRNIGLVENNMDDELSSMKMKRPRTTSPIVAAAHLDEAI